MLLCPVILAHRIFTASGNADLLIGVRSAPVVRPTSAISPRPGLPPFLDVQTFRRSSAPDRKPNSFVSNPLRTLLLLEGGRAACTLCRSSRQERFATLLQSTASILFLKNCRGVTHPTIPILELTRQAQSFRACATLLLSCREKRLP